MGEIKNRQVDREWFDGLLRTKKISQRQLSLLCGIGPTLFNHVLAGRRRMDINLAHKISEILDINFNEVVYHSGMVEKAKEIQIEPKQQLIKYIRDRMNETTDELIRKIEREL